MLGVGELRLVGGKDLLQIRKLPVALAKLFGQRQARLPGFRFNDGGAFRLQFGGHLIVDGLARPGEVFFGLFETGLASAKVGFPGRKLLFELPAGIGEQGRGERFGQLDLGSIMVWVL